MSKQDNDDNNLLLGRWICSWWWEMATLNRVLRKVLSKALSLNQICALDMSQLWRFIWRKSFLVRGNNKGKEKVLCYARGIERRPERWEWWAGEERHEIRVQMWAGSTSLLWFYDRSIIEAFWLCVAEIHLPSRSLRSKVWKPVF